MSEPLQFDRADDEAAPNVAAAPARCCVSCQTAIVDRYYALGDKLLCTPCHAKVLAAVDARLASGSFGAAVLRGSGAALLGAIISYTFTAVTDIQLGLVAILVGYLVGKGVAQGSKGKGGLGYQALAIGLTYLSIVLTFLPEMYRAIHADGHAGILATMLTGVLSLFLPIIVAFKAPLSGLIYGFSLYEAWKLNRAVRLPITGPHAVNSPPTLHVG